MLFAGIYLILYQVVVSLISSNIVIRKIAKYHFLTISNKFSRNVILSTIFILIAAIFFAIPFLITVKIFFIIGAFISPFNILIAIIIAKCIKGKKEVEKDELNVQEE